MITSPEHENYINWAMKKLDITIKKVHNGITMENLFIYKGNGYSLLDDQLIDCLKELIAEKEAEYVPSKVERKAFCEALKDLVEEYKDELL